MEQDYPVLILDNGAHSIKSLYSASSSSPARTYRNTIATSKTERRKYVADELEKECKDYGGLVLRIPFERGYLTNWETQKVVWDRVFTSQKIDPTATSLLITEPIFNLPNIQDQYDQIIFEEYEFASYLRCPGPSMVAFGPDARAGQETAPECVLVVDSGFSFTHIVPTIQGRVISSAIRRIDVGGKLLTNHLKELVSFRQWYMMDQTSVIEKVKQDCCYVSNKWSEDWETANSSSNNPIVQTYVLPDFVPTSTNKLGYLRHPSTGETPPPSEDITMDLSADSVKGKEKDVSSTPITSVVAVEEEEQLLQMSNERFTVPEVLFNPSTIGLNQAGLAESIAQSISSLPSEIQGMFWSNIVCVGGNTGFPGFSERLERELRELAPVGMEVRILPSLSSSPTLTTINSAQPSLSSNPLTKKESFITRAEYQEGGSNAVKRKFGKFYCSDAELGKILIGDGDVVREGGDAI